MGYGLYRVDWLKNIKGQEVRAKLFIKNSIRGKFIRRWNFGNEE